MCVCVCRIYSTRILKASSRVKARTRSCEVGVRHVVGGLQVKGTCHGKV